MSPITTIGDPRAQSEKLVMLAMVYNIPQEPLTTIPNAQKKTFSISSVNTAEDIADFPKELSFDERLSFTDNADNLSCFKKIALDLEHNRSEIFLIKNDRDIIGISTLFLTPYKN